MTTEIDRLNALLVESSNEIASLKRTIEWYQAQAAQMMGAAARAEISAAPVQGVGEVPRYDLILGSMTEKSLGEFARYADVAAPAAPLPAQPEQIQPQQSGRTRPSAEPAGQHDEKCMACDGKGGWVTASWTDPVSGPECEGERCGDCEGTGLAQTQVLAGTAGFSQEEPAAAPLPEQTGPASFKNFHRALCERFNYMHDEQFWWRDQVSLIEHIAAAYPSPVPAPTDSTAPMWISVDFMLPEPDVEVLIDGQEGVEVARYSEEEEDQVDQMGHDAGWWGYKFAACGRSFGNPQYFREAQGQPKYWMHLPTSPSECDECAGTGKCGPDENPNEMDCEVCNGIGTVGQSIAPVSRMGGITSKESAEIAAPGASTEDKQ